MTPRALPSNSSVPRRRRIVALGAVAAVLVLAGGCSTQDLPEIRDTFQLELTLESSRQPVLVDFYKGACARCIELEKMLGPLADEFGGRVVIAKLMLMKPIGGSTEPIFAERNEISNYPTVILYVNGKERHRFVQHYIMEDYRRVLRDSLAFSSPTTRKDAGPGPPEAGRQVN